MQVHTDAGAPGLAQRAGGLADMILKGIAAAMGVAVAVLALLEQVDTRSALGMLGIGLACLAIAQLGREGE